ncbi:DegT/DnrJ/EryC1/StrS family aminotransferase [Ekhidna sp.]|uniref:DegT/DnrJ/EryC1/StrS family aminotransferase n=1 Tax=Ekhidna sp. TaxID=2608089 RepID=UPI003C7CC778
MKNQRIYLSPPSVGEEELAEVSKSLASGWVAPIGPSIDAFESELAKKYEGREVVALNSGTSALHLALVMAGVGANDHVLVSSFTFAACANVVIYQGAIPVFLDSEEVTWNLDPGALSEYLRTAAKTPKALVVTHLYGMPAQINEIIRIAKEHDIIVIEDAAEALGARLNDEEVGTMSDYGILSFNGNKIITTSGGGALICREEDKSRAIYLATQANSGELTYDHKEVGYNYRISNVLAGIGLGQLKQLESFIEKKRWIFDRYKSELEDHFKFLEEPPVCFSNRWLTTCTLKDLDKDIMDLIQFLNSHNIESRRLWKPLHLHEAYDDYAFHGSGVCEEIFEKGICIPSGTGLTTDEQDYVIATVKKWFQS